MTTTALSLYYWQIYMAIEIIWLYYFIVNILKVLSGNKNDKIEYFFRKNFTPYWWIMSRRNHRHTLIILKYFWLKNTSCTWVSPVFLSLPKYMVLVTITSVLFLLKEQLWLFPRYFEFLNALKIIIGLSSGWPHCCLSYWCHSICAYLLTRDCFSRLKTRHLNSFDKPTSTCTNKSSILYSPHSSATVTKNIS